MVDTECLICEQNHAFQRSLMRGEETNHSMSCINSVDASELNTILPLQKAELATHFVVNDKEGRISQMIFTRILCHH